MAGVARSSPRRISSSCGRPVSDRGQRRLDPRERGGPALRSDVARGCRAPPARRRSGRSPRPRAGRPPARPGAARSTRRAGRPAPAGSRRASRPRPGATGPGGQDRRQLGAEPLQVRAITSSSRSAIGSRCPRPARRARRPSDRPAPAGPRDRRIDQRLHQHQRRAQEQGQQRAVEGDLEGRGHARQVVQEAVEVLDHRQHLADVHQRLGDPFDRADEADHRQQIEDVAGQREPAGHVLLVEARGLAVDSMSWAADGACGLAHVAHELADADGQDPPVTGQAEAGVEPSPATRRAAPARLTPPRLQRAADVLEQPGASAKARSFRQSRQSSRPRVRTAQK